MNGVEFNLLEVRNLEKSFAVSKGMFGKNKGYLKAVNDVSFKLFEGETLGLVGESGSGKSTIAKIITGLVRPSFGELEYNGLSLYNLRRKYQIDKSRGQI